MYSKIICECGEELVLHVGKTKVVDTSRYGTESTRRAEREIFSECSKCGGRTSFGEVTCGYKPDGTNSWYISGLD